MSKTKIRAYRHIWESALRVAGEKSGVWHGTFTAGEVVKMSGMSRPTVIAYLKQGQEDGYFEGYHQGERKPSLYKVLIWE